MAVPDVTRELVRWTFALATALLATGCMLFFPVPDSGKGCAGESASYYPTRDVVRVRAADDLGCDFSEIRVEQRSESSFLATGCNSSQEYECEDDAIPGCSLEDAARRESCAPAE